MHRLRRDRRLAPGARSGLRGGRDRRTPVPRRGGGAGGAAAPPRGAGLLRRRGARDREPGAGPGGVSPRARPQPGIDGQVTRGNRAGRRVGAGHHRGRVDGPAPDAAGRRRRPRRLQRRPRRAPGGPRGAADDAHGAERRAGHHQPAAGAGRPRGGRLLRRRGRLLRSEGVRRREPGARRVLRPGSAVRRGVAGAGARRLAGSAHAQRGAGGRGPRARGGRAASRPHPSDGRAGRRSRSRRLSGGRG